MLRKNSSHGAMFSGNCPEARFDDQAHKLPGIATQDLSPAKTMNNMVVDHTRGLHVSIADGRADEPEAALFQVCAQSVGLPAGRRIVAQCLESMDDGFAIDKAPDVAVEAAEVILDIEKAPGVIDGGKQLLSVADNARILEQFAQLSFAIPGYLFRVEIGKGFSIPFPLAQNDVPA